MREVVAVMAMLAMCEATVAIAAPPSGSPAVPASVRKEPVAGFIDSYAAAHRFSGTILVQKGGREIYDRSFGLANVALSVPNANDTVYRIASITKLFTSTLILRLHEQGRLDLDGTIRRYLPDYKGEAGDKVTIHQLLNHTSGLGNIDTIPNIEDDQAAIRAEVAAAKEHDRLPIYQTPYTSDDLLEKFCSGPLVTTPGTVFSYNNADYIILGKIIERLYGADYAAVVASQILAPLGMAHSGLARHRDVIPGLADSYSLAPDRRALENDTPIYPENWYAAGAMYSTAHDLLRFSNALFENRLIGAKALAAMTTPGLDRYGYGLWVFHAQIDGKDHRIAKRPGRIMGVQSQLYRFLDSDVTVIILSNAGTTDLDAFVAEIGRRAI